MPAKLFCRTGQLAGASYQIDDEVSIGKGAENTIQLSPGTISRKHARIYFDKANTCYFLEDFGSRNGTKVDGMTVKGTEKLHSLHIITFADECDFIFQVLDPARAGEEVPAEVEPPAHRSPRTKVEEEFPLVPPLHGTPALTVKQASDEKSKTQLDDGVIVPPVILGEISPTKERKGMDGGEEHKDAVKFLLEVEDPSGVKKIFDLKEGENVIGREKSCDICIVDSSMSRKHAVITVRSFMVTLKDLESKNHTFLDDQKVGYEVELRPGARLAFGMVRAVLLKETSR